MRLTFPLFSIDQIHLPKHDSWIEIKLESLQDKSEFVIRNLPTLMMRGGSIIPIQPVVQNNVQAMKALTLLVALDHNNLATGNLYLDEGKMPPCSSPIFNQ